LNNVTASMTVLRRLGCGLLGAMCGLAASAADVRVLSAGAMQPALIAATSAMRATNGHEVKVEYAIASELRRRVGGGEIADVLFAPVAVVAELTKSGRLAAEGQVAAGRVGAGVVARVGAPLPDITSADALKRSLLAAERVVYNRASSGVYIESMLKKLGVYDELGARLIRYDDGTAVMHHLMKGQGREFGFGGITDILMYKDKGLQLVGPLPEDIQNYTAYTAALVAAAVNGDAARDYLRFLASPEGKALFAANGIR
jgi:molybdate transport system substrate-binding protein